MKSSYDLAVIGAGPAGMAAAVLAAELGASTLVLDEQGEPGGQIYRSVETVARRRPAALGHVGTDYAYGAGLAEKLRRSGVDYVPDAVVWNVSPERAINFSRGGRSHEVRCRHLLIATGALERPVPIPGWTLPGVMTVGALQILLKSSGLAPAGRIVLAGAGPLLLLLAAQYIRAGIKPAAVVETVGFRQYLRALAHTPAALKARSYLAKGLDLRRSIKAAGIPVYAAASELRVEGTDRAEALVFEARGRRHRLDAEVIALHQGVVPNQQLTRLLECDHRWDARQRCFRPILNDWFATTVDGVSVAGDGAGIGGAKAAEYRGRLATLGAAERLGLISRAERDRMAAPERRAHRRDQAIRPLLETLYAPPDEILRPADPVIVCRCEEVTAGAVRDAVRLGCPGPNQAKSFLRCGMGPCQGRLCGLTVTETIAAARGLSPDATGYYRIRPPIKPLTLDELAALDDGPQDHAA